MLLLSSFSGILFFTPTVKAAVPSTPSVTDPDGDEDYTIGKTVNITYDWAGDPDSHDCDINITAWQLNMFENFTALVFPGGYYVYGNYWRGQAFKIGSVGTNTTIVLKNITIWARRVGTPNTIYTNLYKSNETGIPTGSSISSGSFDANNLSTASAGSKVNILMSHVVLQPGQNYTFILNKTGGGTSNSILLRDCPGNTFYPNGSLISSINGGVSYNNQSADAYFEVNGYNLTNYLQNRSVTNAETLINSSWYYNWDTTGMDVGAYIVNVTATDQTDNGFSVAYSSEFNLTYMNVTTNTTTGTSEWNTTFHGFLANASGDTAVGFEWGTTTNYGNESYVVTMVSGWNPPTSINSPYGFQFSRELWEYNVSIAANYTIRYFLNQSGILDTTDYVFRYNSTGDDWESWWKSDSENEVEYIDNITNHPEFYYYIHSTGSDTFALDYDNMIETEGTEFNHTVGIKGGWDNYELKPNVTYHYRAFAKNGTIIVYGDDMNFTTDATSYPTNPYGIDTVYYDSATTGYLNITWTTGNYTDATVIIRNNASYPNNATDGWEIYNGTHDWYNHSGVTSTCYFRLFSYNNTGVSKYSGGVNAPWGGLGLNAYDESNDTGITFDIEIINDDATDVYNATGLSNTKYIDLDDIPYGDDTVFIVDSDAWGGYKQRIYYHDLAINTFYNYSFYLTRNVSSIHLYYLRVLNEVEGPIKNANVNVSINVGGSYVSVANLITDANGYASLHLNSSRTYHVNITHDDYLTENAPWSPDPDYYGIYYPKIFVMEYEEITIEEPETPAEAITFNGYINSTGYLFINYTDAMGQTLNTSICVYEINLSTGLESVLTWFNGTTDADFQHIISNSSINTSNNYRIVINYNHSKFGHQRQMFLLHGGFSPLTTQTDTDNIFVVYGTNPLGWSNFIMFLFLVAGCVYGDSKDAGMYMVLLGGLFLFINYFIGFNTTMGVFAGGIVPMLFIIGGIIIAWNDKRKRVVG